MVLQSQTGLERIQEAFDELCRNIMDEELSDSGRTLRRKGLHQMKLSLSPMETRHESAIRVIVGQLGAIGIRLKRLEQFIEDNSALPGPLEVALQPPTEAEKALLSSLEKSPAEKPLTEE